MFYLAVIFMSLSVILYLLYYQEKEIKESTYNALERNRNRVLELEEYVCYLREENQLLTQEIKDLTNNN